MLRIETSSRLIEAIRRLAVRGAPALGVAGALGVALRRGGVRPARAVATRTPSPGCARPGPPPSTSPGAWTRRAGPLRAAGGTQRRAAIRDDDIAACEPMAPRRRPRPGAGDRAGASASTACNTGGLAAVDGAPRSACEDAARAGRAGRGDRAGDPAAAAGRPAHHVGARPHGRAAPARRRLRRPYLAPRGTSTPSHRRRPDRRQRRHRQQDRLVRAGARRAEGRGAVHRRHARDHHRPGHPLGAADRDRGPRRRRDRRGQGHAGAPGGTRR